MILSYHGGAGIIVSSQQKTEVMEMQHFILHSGAQTPYEI